jgi:hypothetical protein
MANTTGTLTQAQLDAVNNGLGSIGTEGDLFYRDATGLQKLAKGTASQVLTMNGGATAPSWADASGGAWEFITSSTASNSATIDFTGLSNTYDRYVVQMSELVPSVDNGSLYVRFGTGGSPTYVTSSNYCAVVRTSANIGPWADSQNTNTDHINLSMGIAQFGTATGEHMNGEIILAGCASASLHTSIKFDLWGGMNSSSSSVSNSGSGILRETTAVTAIRIYLHNGNIASGYFRLYGLVKS